MLVDLADNLLLQKSKLSVFFTIYMAKKRELFILVEKIWKKRIEK